MFECLVWVWRTQGNVSGCIDMGVGKSVRKVLECTYVDVGKTGETWLNVLRLVWGCQFEKCMNV